ncbi:hypothetical protein FACS1894181_17830 [Bacteroidia bacterium]|nr:hypothetical protein FACS1894181_17830 [Bacteroidia bacterium]
MSALFLLCSAYSWGQVNNHRLDSLKQFRSDPPVPESKSVGLRASIDNHTDLGDGFFLLNASIDANNSVVGLKINSDQLAALSAEATFYAEFQGITKNVYGKFKDDFDFIFYVLDKDESAIINNLGFYGINLGVSNAVSGLGQSIYSNTSAWGSAGKLQSVMYLPAYDLIAGGPALHEIAHNWAAYICPTYDQNGNPYGGHWGISNAGGQLGGFRHARLVETDVDGVPGKNKYQASMSPDTNADGSYKYPGFGPNANGGNGLPYSDIEIYLMGMKSAQELKDAGFTLDIYSGNSSIENDFWNDGYFYSTQKTSYNIDDLIALNGNGPRTPDAGASQKQFKLLTVVLTDETNEHYADIIDHVNWFAGPENDNTYPWLYNFSRATGGKGSILADGVKNTPLVE